MIFNKTGVKLISRIFHTWTHRLTCRLTCRLGARAHTRYAAPYLHEPVWFPLPRRSSLFGSLHLSFLTFLPSALLCALQLCGGAGRLQQTPPPPLRLGCARATRRWDGVVGGWVAASHGFAAELAGSLAGHRVFICGIKTWSVARAAVESADVEMLIRARERAQANWLAPVPFGHISRARPLLASTCLPMEGRRDAVHKEN